MKYSDKYHKPIERQLLEFMYQQYYAPIFELMKSPVFNSQSDLINALRRGRIKYQRGVFTGKTTAATARELRKFAEYDGRRKVWKVTGTIPMPIHTAAVTAARQFNDMLNRIDQRLLEIQQGIPDAVENMRYGIDDPLFAMNQAADQTLGSLGILPDMTPELSEQIRKRYSENMNFDIVGFNGEQITRLRDMTKNALFEGIGRDALADMLQDQFESTAAKARFWARNETMLLFAQLRDERYQDAGVTRYRWVATMDERTRQLHKDHNNKIFSYASPPLIDERTGKRGNPGEYYGCRCSAIPVLPGQD